MSARSSYELSYVNASWLGEVNAAHYAGVHGANATATHVSRYSKLNANTAGRRLGMRAHARQADGSGSFEGHIRGGAGNIQ